MAQCIKCKREVGCGCNLTKGLCGACASQEKENKSAEAVHLETEIKTVNDSEVHTSRQSG